MNYYCAIYLMLNIDLKEIKSMLKEYCEGHLNGFDIQNNIFELHIVNNDYNYRKAKLFPDGFLYFNYKIEITPLTDNFILYKRTISNLLKWLWKNNIPAIAACDFEDELPLNGGYKDRNIPWP